MPEKHPGDKVARYHQQRRLMEETQTTTSGSRRQKAQMELDRSYAEESELQHHEASSRVEPAKKTKARKTKKHLAQSANIGPEENWQNLGRSKEHYTRQREMESHCSRPMFPLGRSGLSQVS